MSARNKFTIYNIQSIIRLLFVIFTFYILHSIFTTPAYAQNSTPSASQQSASESDTPVPTDIGLANLFHTFSCLSIGSSVIGRPCLSYRWEQDSSGHPFAIPYLSSDNLKGGGLGVVTKLLTGLYDNQPIRATNYLASIKEGFGVKEVHAQVGGSGSFVLDPILKLWKVSRNISYILMMVIFLVIGFMVMFRQKINPQTVITAQAALPGLIIGLVLITFSYFLAALLTDMAFVGTNLVGYYFSLAQGGGITNLLASTTQDNVLSIMGNLMNGLHQEDIAKGLSTFFDALVDPTSRMVRAGAALMAYQIGSSFGPAIFAGLFGATCGIVALTGTTLSGFLLAPLSIAGVTACIGLGNAIGGPAAGGFLAVKTAQDPPGMVAWAFWIAALVVILYSMVKLLLRLINCYLSIILLTITAPFHFLAASLPGRQGIATDWVRNMLCNVLAFPAVMGVFYFVNYLLGPISGSPFTIIGSPQLTGTATLPLLGGLELSFIRVLLAFGALISTPAIPDIICQTIGKVGRAGQIIGQEIGAAQKGGQGYLSQAQSNAGKVFGDIEATRDKVFDKQIIQGSPAAGTVTTYQPGSATKLRQFTRFKRPQTR